MMIRLWVVLFLSILFLLQSKSAVAEIDSSVFQKNIEIALQEEGLTGAVWGIQNAGGMVTFGSAGYRDAENKLPFSTDTRFHVGSVVKAVLATAVLRLVTEGKLDLDAPVSRYIEDFTFDNPWGPGQAVTVRHLLDHTSGLDDARLWQLFSTRVSADTPLREIYERQPDVLRIRSRPSSRLSYSNMGYGLLGLLIESLTGERYEAYLDREFLLPLGMSDSSFAFTTQLGEDADPRLSWGHVDDGSRYAAVPLMLRPAGQFTTTISDWMRFATFLMGDGRIDGEVFINSELMRDRGVASTTEAARAGLKAGYALGLSRRDRYAAIGLCHSGNIIGFNALMCVYPESQQAFLVSINTDSETANYRRLFELIASELAPVTPQIPPDSPAAGDISDWNGFYILDPNRFESFRYLDTIFGFVQLQWNGVDLLLQPLQGEDRVLRPTGDYLFSANDRQVDSHVLMRSDLEELLFSDGYRTYVKVSQFKLFGLWFSLVLGLVAVLWFLLSGAYALIRNGVSGFSSPQGLALVGVLGLLLPIPVFFTQSFMALGDMTAASLLLAGSTIFMPLMMLVAILKIAQETDRRFQSVLHAFFAIAVLQWCVVLVYFGMLPLRLWA